ncbi:MAG: FtsW/RodA/SpoVE family cell cycle protein [Flavobacteriaceae bacterium]
MRLQEIFWGDRVLWVLMILLAFFSFLPVYSASTNLSYVVGVGSPVGYLVKHFVIILFGFGITFLVHRIPYNYFKGIAVIAFPIVVVLLLYTLLQGTTIDGANASRWIKIPLIGVSFQTSTLAFVHLLVYVAFYLHKNYDRQFTFQSSFIALWLPVLAIVFLILPANFSTAAMLFFMVLMLTFVGGYPFKYLLYIFGFGFVVFLLFILTAKAFPEAMPNRVDTWRSRIENFSSNQSGEENYQIELSKTAIATGGLFGKGAGKSVMKNFLPQSSSDFIYAIIVEEYGVLGGIALIVLYLIVLFRILVNAHKTEEIFGKLLIIGMGIPIVFQAFVNMGVALQVLPVTGQTLPLVSSGGTSVWMTCLAFGILLSVTARGQHKSSNSSHNPIIEFSETL